LGVFPTAPNCPGCPNGRTTRTPSDEGRAERRFPHKVDIPVPQFGLGRDLIGSADGLFEFPCGVPRQEASSGIERFHIRRRHIVKRVGPQPDSIVTASPGKSGDGIYYASAMSLPTTTPINEQFVENEIVNARIGIDGYEGDLILTVLRDIVLCEPRLGTELGSRAQCYSGDLRSGEYPSKCDHMARWHQSA
jgi:hypothetical protein